MSNTTTNTQTQFEILGQEFDLDRLADIANHGMSGGVSGFIYSSELYDVWVEFGTTILSALDEYADELGEPCGTVMAIQAITKGDDEVYVSPQMIKETMIWMYVEMMAYNLCCSNEHPDVC